MMSFAAAMSLFAIVSWKLYLLYRINKFSFTVGVKFITRARNDTAMLYIFIGILLHINTSIIKAFLDQPYPYKAQSYHYVYR